MRIDFSDALEPRKQFNIEKVYRDGIAHCLIEIRVDALLSVIYKVKLLVF